MIRPVLGSRASIGGVLGSGRGGASNGLLTGLVAYWGLDEASGNALDKHTGGLTLTQANSPGADTGKVYSTARTFNGSSQYFFRSSETATRTGDIDFVLAGWIYITSTSGTNDYVIASKYFTPTNNREYNLYWQRSTNRFVFSVSADGTFPSGYNEAVANTFGAPSLNTWYLVVGWHDATANTLNITVNNSAVDSVAHSTGVYLSTANFVIGALANPTQYATGRIGPVALWKNRTLSADDRTALWNGGAGLAYSAFS